MKILRLTLRPLTPFGTPLVGDTLFGHLCWALRERFGKAKLGELLDGYTLGMPFLVVSDAFPRGFVPRPVAPDVVLGSSVDPVQRKLRRQVRWLPAADAHLPVAEWLGKAQACDVTKSEIITQNTINRLTGTTGHGVFAPRRVERIAYKDGVRVDVYALIDESKLDLDAVQGLIADVGLAGYGRDSSAGLGKFAVEAVTEHTWGETTSRHWLALAPCAPDSRVLEPSRCYYQPVTRFGRHGNIGVRLGVPFKRPLLMIGTGALLTTREPLPITFHGSGLGGSSRSLSSVIPETVHQGYAPVVPLNLELPS